MPSLAATVDRPVVLLSHRGPVTFRRSRGQVTASRAAGGLATALTGLSAELTDAVWVCAAASAEDRRLAKETGRKPLMLAKTGQPRLLTGEEESDEPAMRLRMVAVDKHRHEQFYSIISNPLLWFVQHSLYGLAGDPVLTKRDRSAFEDGYVAVNKAFADTVSEEIERVGGKALVMLHDYHFYLVGGQLRDRHPDATISHFVHIPWPGPDQWRILPADMRERILRGLLGCDVVAFHTQRFARNFLLTAQELLDVPIDMQSMTLRIGDRVVAARHYPISADVAAFERLAKSPKVRRLKRQLGADFLSGDRRLILRVDRTDPSKNIVRGFRAFDLMLQDHPELHGEVSFFALLQPSRQDIPEYADYIAAIGSIVAEVNARHGGNGWQPIQLRLEDDLALAVASYAICDVLVVNAVNDGMNLVAKEMTVVNERGGVLILSENAGAHQELGDYAITVNPFDVQQQADALYTALQLDAETRKRQCAAAADVVRSNDVMHWFNAQIADLLPGAFPRKSTDSEPRNG